MPFITDNDIKILQTIAKLEHEIKNDTYNKNVDEADTYFDRSKLYKPITDTVKTTSEESNKKLSEIEKSSLDTNKMINTHIADKIGILAKKYLPNRGSRKNPFCIAYDEKENKYYLGKTYVSIQNDDIIIYNRKFEGTKGLWELLSKTDINPANISESDKDNYYKLLKISNALFGTNGKVKGNKSQKYLHIIKPRYEIHRIGGNLSVKSRNKHCSTNFLPNDPNFLVNRLKVILANKSLKHNIDNYNEGNAICQQLLKQNNIDTPDYKNIVKLLEK